MYTNVWSDIQPSDTELANTLGADLRKLRLDIRERMNALVVDWTADPVVTLANDPTIVFQRVIPACAFASNQNAQSNTMLDGKVQISAPGVLYYAPIDFVPIGGTIQLVEYLLDRGTATHINCQLCRMPFSVTPDAVTVIDAIDVSAAGKAIHPSAVLSHEVDAGFQYFLKLQVTTVGSGWIYAARVSYGATGSTPNLLHF